MKDYQYLIGKIIMAIAIIVAAIILANGFAQAGHNLGAMLSGR